MPFDPEGKLFLNCSYNGICHLTGTLFVDATPASFHFPDVGDFPNIGSTCSITGPWGTYIGFADGTNPTEQTNPDIPTPGIWHGTSRCNWGEFGFGQVGSPVPGQTVENAVLIVLADGMDIANSGNLTLGFPVGPDVTLVGSGGTPPYIYSITCGRLPGGIHLNTLTGALTGEVTESGSFPLCLKVTDLYGFIGTANGVLVVEVNSPQWILHRFDMKPRAEERA